MVLNDRLLTTQKDGLSNFKSDQPSFLPSSGGQKKKTKKAIASSQAVPSFSHARFDFPLFLRPATQANYKSEISLLLH